MYENQARAIATSVTGAHDPRSDRPATVLEGAVHSVSKEISELNCALELLAKRMEPVLQPEVPMPQATGEKLRAADQPHSMIVTELAAQSSRIQSLTFYVNSLAGRCEA